MTTLANTLAGIGTKRGSARTPLSPAAVASARYAPYMNAQMRAIMETYRKVISDIEGVLPDIMAEALGPTLELAKSYTPVATGKLKDSGYIEKRNSASGGINVVIGFAKGGNPDYAAIVHERVDMFHRVGRAKFLESALLEDMGNVYGRIVERCKI